ncbi:hypothetical protein [Mesorhizobium sp.]
MQYPDEAVTGGDLDLRFWHATAVPLSSPNLPRNSGGCRW